MNKKKAEKLLTEARALAKKYTIEQLYERLGKELLREPTKNSKVRSKSKQKLRPSKS